MFFGVSALKAPLPRSSSPAGAPRARAGTEAAWSPSAPAPVSTESLRVSSEGLLKAMAARKWFGLLRFLRPPGGMGSSLFFLVLGVSLHPDAVGGGVRARAQPRQTPRIETDISVTRLGTRDTSISAVEDSAEAENGSLHARARAATEAARSLWHWAVGTHRLITKLHLGHGILGWEARATSACQPLFRVERLCEDWLAGCRRLSANLQFEGSR